MSTHGVDLRTNTLVTGIEMIPKPGCPGEEVMKITLTVRTLGNMRTGPGSSEVSAIDIRKYTLKSDKLVFVIGIEPSTELASQAGFEVDSANGGIMSNEKLQVGDPSHRVYAAGDSCSYFDRVLGRRRYEHWEHAIATGKHAAANMVAQADKQLEFTDMSSFWSDLLDLGIHFDAVGNIDSQLKTVGYWDINRQQYQGTSEMGVHSIEHKEYRKGVVYYLKDNKVVGALVWNLPDGEKHLEVARKMIRSGRVLKDPVMDLRHLIPVDGGDDIMTS
jgi:programmed cell death 8 (apoptosis-inducing factor)